MATAPVMIVVVVVERAPWSARAAVKDLRGKLEDSRVTLDHAQFGAVGRDGAGHNVWSANVPEPQNRAHKSSSQQDYRTADDCSWKLHEGSAEAA